MARKPNAKSKPETARRLRLTRSALGLTQRELCRRTNIGVTAYNHMEKGRARPSIDAAIAIVETFGVTLDWIYLGDIANIPHRLAAAISALRDMGE